MSWLELKGKSVFEGVGGDPCSPPDDLFQVSKDEERCEGQSFFRTY